MSILVPEEINTELKTLISVTETLPPEIQTQLKLTLTQLNNLLSSQKQTLKLVQEALNQLALDVKYLVFDLEATRRERDEYKQQLEE